MLSFVCLPSLLLLSLLMVMSLFCECHYQQCVVPCNAGTAGADAVLLIFTLAAVEPQDMPAMLHSAFQVKPAVAQEQQQSPRCLADLSSTCCNKSQCSVVLLIEVPGCV